LNFKFVRTDLGNFNVYLFICLSPELFIGPSVYIGFVFDWRVLPLCLWGLTLFTWYVFFDASEEDRHHLAEDGTAGRNAW
jgi:hypothetical protein